MIHAKLQDFHMTTEANTADLAFFNPAVKTMLHRLGSAEDYTRTQGGSLKTQLLFLIDHALQARLKIWADAEVSEEPAIIEKFAKISGDSRATDLAFLFHVRAFSCNYENDTMQRSAGEVRSTETVQTGKAYSTLRTQWMGQKQTLLWPTCIEPASFATEYSNKI